MEGRRLAPGAHPQPDGPGETRPPNPHAINAEDLDEEKLILAKIDRLTVDLERARQSGSHNAAKHLGRDLDRAVAELTALRAERRKTSIPEDEATFLADLATAAERMPKSHLHVFVDAYLAWHRMTLVRDPRWKKGENGQWGLGGRANRGHPRDEE
jgi:hypothetical protein